MNKVIKSRKALAITLACVADFAVDDFGPERKLEFEDVVQAAYIAACFMAQNAPGGVDGVEMEWAVNSLKMMERMPYEARLELAETWVKELWP